MAAQETKFREPSYTIPDPGYFSLPGSVHRFRDSKPTGWGSMNMFRSIQVSSDTYYYKLAWDMGIDRLSPQLAKFGFGSQTGIDLDGEARGVLPSKAWKRIRFAGKRYPEAARTWTPADVVPIGIGQGYNTYTPLQVAHAIAILANNGVVYQPHVVKEIENLKTGKISKVAATPVRDNHHDPANLAFVKSAMEAVLKPGGTAARIGAGLSYTMAGKTGTAQVVQIKQGAKYNASALAEIHQARMTNMMRRRRPTYIVLNKAAMEEFVRTGRQSDHLHFLRNFTPKERKQILDVLVQQARENPFFHLYFAEALHLHVLRLEILILHLKLLLVFELELVLLHSYTLKIKY